MRPLRGHREEGIGGPGRRAERRGQPREGHCRCVPDPRCGRRRPQDRCRGQGLHRHWHRRMSAIRRRWRFTGTVQGVGFRYYARAAALHLGLTGWVANNWDGSVTLEAQGERAALDALVPLIERSNRWARIENVEVTTLPVKEHEYGFGERSGE